MGRSYRTLIALLLSAGLAAPLLARDNTGHVVGVGFQHNPAAAPGLFSTVQSAPRSLLSAKFAAAPNAEFAALVGFSFDDDYFSVAFGGKALLHLVPDEQVNVYVAAAVYPTLGSEGMHRFSYLFGPGVAYYLPGASEVELFAEFGIGGSLPLTDTARRSPLAGPAPYAETLGSVVLGLHYWF